MLNYSTIYLDDVLLPIITNTIYKVNSNCSDDNMNKDLLLLSILISTWLKNTMKGTDCQVIP